MPTSYKKTPQVFAEVAGKGAVFQGTPVSKTTGSDAQGYSVDIVEFGVAGFLDGQVTPITTVSTATQPTACGADFTVGTEYLVVASTENTNGATWSATSCGGTSLASDRISVQSAVSMFGQPRPTTEPAPPEVVAAEQGPDHTKLRSLGGLPHRCRYGVGSRGVVGRTARELVTNRELGMGILGCRILRGSTLSKSRYQLRGRF